MTLFAKDQLIIQKRFPTLRYVEKETNLFLCGTFPINLSHSTDIPPITDRFQLRIAFSADYSESLPKVYEVGGRKEVIAKKAGFTKLEDLHFIGNEDHSACLSATLDIRRLFPQGSTIDVFLEKLVAPFFYGLSYFEQHGKFPLGEYSHGSEGVREAYAKALGCDNLTLIIKSIQLISKSDRLKAHRLCPCGSKKRICDCHPKILKSLFKIKRYMTPKELRDDLKLLKALGRLKKTAVRLDNTSKRTAF